MTSQKKCQVTLDHVDHKICNKPSYTFFRVHLLHIKSNRKSWQKLYVCKTHFLEFLKSEGKEWVQLTNENKIRSLVLDYQLGES